ncbi:hypothetical protein BSKO_03680 [Bryopsis sp. KO-2023]|nr:hypothetical protein BSKO_03680 [Bryopsis sp. KO-2023]
MSTSSVLGVVAVLLLVIRPGVSFPHRTGSMGGLHEALLKGEANDIATVLISSADVESIVAAINKALPEKPQHPLASLDFDMTKLSFQQKRFFGAVAQASLQTGDFNKLAEIIVKSGFGTLNGEEVKGTLADIHLMMDIQQSLVDRQGRKLLVLCAGCKNPSGCDVCAYASCNTWWC